MKVLCNCWRKSDTCVACYMANVEDWNQIHAIAMSAEAQRRLEEDLRFLESINVWHLVNLRSNPNPPTHHQSLYGYPPDSLTMVQVPQQIGGYNHHSHNSYHGPYGPPQNYSHNHNHNQLPPPPPPPSSILGPHSGKERILPSSGYGTSLPYPDLIIHTRELTPQGYYHNHGEPKDIIADDYKDFSPVIQNGLSLQENSRLKHLALLPSKEPDDYDADDRPPPPPAMAVTINERLTPSLPDDSKKTVKFTDDTIFVERDMNSPFWRAFTERRRIRRINRQRKQLNAQIAHASYQPSIVEIVKTAFGKSSNNSNNNNNNNNKDTKDGNHGVSVSAKKKNSKSEVLVYDNNSQMQQEKIYVYSSHPPSQPREQKRGSKFLQMFACQCCSASSQSP